MSALIRITLFLLFSLNLPVLADSPPLEKMPGKTFADVSARAKVESTTGPIWGNAPDPSALPFHQTFTGTVTADATMTKLAIFSDDGCDVFVDGVKVWSAKDQPQALPTLKESLHELPVVLMPGDHTVEIDYSNVIYNVADTSKGIPPDIDGCTLFQYGGADITATAGLTDGVIRACAGAVQDSVHEATVTIHAAYSGVNAVNLPLTLTYDASFDYTDCQVPQFIDDLNQNRPVSTLTRTTDSNGNITITVLSCDLISTPNVLITNNGTQIGSIPCNFAADQSLRHYGILTYDPGEGSGTDTGWDFNSYSLINPG